MRIVGSRFLMAGVLALAGAAAVGLLSVWLPGRPIDFDHYTQAGQMLWRGENPYAQVEFFAPPWLALFLGPLWLLPPSAASALWVLSSLLCVCGAALLSVRWLDFPRRPVWRGAVVMAAALMPAALFVFITGQLSALVGLAVVAAAWRIAAGGRPRGWVAFGLLAATLKPHIVILPALLCVLELARSRQWKTLGWGLAGLAGLAAFAFALLPGWPFALLEAWQKGAYRGGPGLVAPGYVGLPELGIPAWVFVPLLFYVLWGWWQSGLTPRTLALAMGTNMLLMPYSRSYDHVVLIFPALVSLAETNGLRRWGVGSLVSAAVWVLPFLRLSVLTPVLVTLALLWSGRTLPPPPINLAHPH